MFTVDILFSGFSGKMADCALGWGTWALVRDGTRNILLDTGCVGLRHNFDNILKKYGLTRTDIDTVLLSHLHFDHACNVDLLPRANFVVTQREWEFANDIAQRDLFIQESAIMPLRNANVRFVKGDEEEIFPGITTMMTPGHTPGSVSYILHQDNGEKWVLAGDAAKTRGELRTREVQMSLDPVATAESLNKIMAVADRVLPGHDGWITVKNGEVIPEGGNDKEILFGQGVTANGGMEKVTLHMD